MFFFVLPQPPHRAFLCHAGWGGKAFAQLCRGVWEHTLAAQELNVFVTLSLGARGETPVHIANQHLQNKKNAGFYLCTFKRNNILMICAVGVILPKWTMIYVFHVRIGFLRG